MQVCGKKEVVVVVDGKKKERKGRIVWEHAEHMFIAVTHSIEGGRKLAHLFIATTRTIGRDEKMKALLRMLFPLFY